jgi:hypothetical protein
MAGWQVMVVIGVGVAGTGGRMSILHCAEEIQGSIGGRRRHSYRSHLRITVGVVLMIILLW